MTIKPASVAHALAIVGTIATQIAALHYLTGPAQTYVQLAGLLLGGGAIYGTHVATIGPDTTAPTTNPEPPTGLGALLMYVVTLAGASNDQAAEQAVIDKLKAFVADPSNGVTGANSQFQFAGQVDLTAGAPAQTPQQKLEAAVAAGDLAAAQAALAEINDAGAPATEPAPAAASEVKVAL